MLVLQGEEVDRNLLLSEVIQHAICVDYTQPKELEVNSKHVTVKRQGQLRSQEKFE